MAMLKFRRSHEGRRTRKPSGWRGLVQLIGLGLLLASVIRELRLPSSQRTWHGVLFGKIPYDLRFPTPRRVAGTMWNPKDHRALVPTAFGVGWTINLAAVRSALPF